MSCVQTTNTPNNAKATADNAAVPEKTDAGAITEDEIVVGGNVGGAAVVGDLDGTVGRVGEDVVGRSVGLDVGVLDGARDGDLDGLCVGDFDGVRDGDLDGFREGVIDGEREGNVVGDFDGFREGDLEGNEVKGLFEGDDVVGVLEGPRDGEIEGNEVVGDQVGNRVGTDGAGATVGEIFSDATNIVENCAQLSLYESAPNIWYESETSRGMMYNPT